MTPSRLTIVLAAALALLALGTVYLPQLLLPWKLVAALFLGFVLLDFTLGWRLPNIALTRDVRHSIPVGAWSKISLGVENRASRSLSLRVHDHHPGEYEVDNPMQSLSIPVGKRAQISYRIRPPHRGDGHFPGADLIIGSPLGLWHRKSFIPLEDRVKVFPNFRKISHYALLATDNRLSQLGIHSRQRRGEGSDFHQLREYRAGDSLRQIDWKATSRMHKLISKEYQDERDQQVVFMLDCGRRMHHAEEGRVHLDQALNAMLLLAYVASRQSDAVGFMAFGGTQRWYPPQKGGEVVQRLLNQTYDITSTAEAADYLTAAKELMNQQRRRALIVIMTNTRDEDHQDLLSAARLLQTRHLVVIADLREEMLDETLRQRVTDFDSALRFHSVSDYLESRKHNHELLQHQGAIILDLLAPQLPLALVNQYLSIKASGIL